MGKERVDFANAENAVSFHHPPAFLSFFGLDSRCNSEDVHASYHKLAQELHPDHGGDAKRFQLLQSNYAQAMKFLKKREMTSVLPHSFQLSPFSNYDRIQKRFWKVVGAGSAVAVVGIAIAWWLGYGIHALCFVLGFGVIVVVPVFVSSIRPLYVGSCFFGVSFLFIVLATTTMTQVDVLQWATNPPGDLKSRQFLLMGTLGFSLMIVLACGAGWIISIANHDD